MLSGIYWLLGYDDLLPEITDKEKKQRHLLMKQIKFLKNKPMKLKSIRLTKETFNIKKNNKKKRSTKRIHFQKK
jgi:hypothetical protein